MSKFASRVYSDVIRRELHDQGVSVVVIEPMFYKTPIVNVEQTIRGQNRAFDQSPDYIKEAYNEESRQKLLDETKVMADYHTRDSSEVVDSLEDAVTLVNPKLYYRCGGFVALLINWALSIMPEVLVDPILRLLSR